jgi:anaerobic ribonucleoside-triphosphate reductase activating protein
MNEFEHYSDSTAINVAHVFPRVGCLGPGKRAILWVQGCVNSCPGCVTPEMRPLEIRHLVRVELLASLLLGIPDIEGITVVGGEPALQFRSLAQLFGLLRQGQLSIMLYTGYRLSDLRKILHKEMDTFLESIDILVDGRYDANLDRDQMWRGSENQQIHFLTSRYKAFAWALHAADRSQELFYDDEGRYVYVGIPPSANRGAR